MVISVTPSMTTGRRRDHCSRGPTAAFPAGESSHQLVRDVSWAWMRPTVVRQRGVGQEEGVVMRLKSGREVGQRERKAQKRGGSYLRVLTSLAHLHHGGVTGNGHKLCDACKVVFRCEV